MDAPSSSSHVSDLLEPPFLGEQPLRAVATKDPPKRALSNVTTGEETVVGQSSVFMSPSPGELRLLQVKVTFAENYSGQHNLGQVQDAAEGGYGTPGGFAMLSSWSSQGPSRALVALKLEPLNPLS